MRVRQSSTRLPEKPGRSQNLLLSRSPGRRCRSVGEIALIIEGSGIAEIAWELQLDWEADAFSVVEEAHGSWGRFGRL